MAFIKKIISNDSVISIYRSKNGNTVRIIKDQIPQIFSRTRTVTFDSTGMPVKCKDIMIRKGKIVSSDCYTPSTKGATVLKDKNGIVRLFENLPFTDVVNKFLK